MTTTPDTLASAGEARRGWRWTLARALWAALFVLSAALYVAGIFVYHQHLVWVCYPTPEACVIGPNNLPSPADIAALGVSVPVYAGLVIAIEVISALVHFGVAAIIFRRAPANRVAFLGALFLFTWGASFSNPITALGDLYAEFNLLSSVVAYVGVTTFFAFFAVFPNGAFVPRQMRLVLAAWIVLAFVIEFSPDDTELVPNLALVLCAFFGLVGFLVSLIVAQVYRYWRVSSPAQRQQAKWVVFGLAVTIFGFLFVLMVSIFADPLPPPRALLALLLHAALHACGLAIPVALMASILETRLWAIDLLIRRTLVYSVLTVALALVYGLSVLVLQQVFELLTGRARSELVTVLSTLVIAALFTTLRARVQTLIDRRFYRQKYDAARTLAAFAASVRDDLDLDALTERLLAVVDGTMQPEHVGLWLKPSD